MTDLSCLVDSVFLLYEGLGLLSRYAWDAIHVYCDTPVQSAHGWIRNKAPVYILNN